MSTRELRRAEILGAGVEQDASVDRCGKDTGVELPANEETLDAVSRRRSEGSAADPEEVFGNVAGAIWNDAGSGALNGLMREFTAVLSHSWYNAARRISD